MRVRNYGTSGPTVVLIHGGPGAPGYVAPIARGLQDAFRVVEPFQRRSGGDEPLTVARHVEDLHELVTSLVDPRPALVGSSWGAMLALAFAAAHPRAAGSIVLIGCGTFDQVARRRMIGRIDARMTSGQRRRYQELANEIADPDDRLRAQGDLLDAVYSHALLEGSSETEKCDARGYEEAWNDMLRLQSEGVYPAAFRAIESPVLMLHGAVDPHPGEMIRASLQPHIPQLEYREWEACGHYPWRERAVHQEFFAVLREWLAAATASGSGP